MAFKTFQEESRERYGRNFCGDKSQNASTDEIKVGVLLRIAEAVEKMAVDHDNLVRQRDNYKRWWEEEKDHRKNLEHHACGLRGVITRIKKQAKKGR